MPIPAHDLFTHLFRESGTALRRYVRRFVGSREIAEEIVQEAFLRTYEQGERVETPRAFLFSTARNLASNANRDQRTAKTDGVGDFDELSVVSPVASLEEHLLSDERAQLIREAVSHLPRQCRAAFALRVFHECSYKEIAERLSISVKTVERHVGRGLKDTHDYLSRRYRERNDRRR